MADQRNVQRAAVPNPLLAKVKAGPESGFDFAAADNVILELAKEFAARLPAELEKIEAAFKAVQASPEDEELRNALFRLVHDLKGQAGTFDYNLITVVGNDLCRFLERRVQMTSRRLKVVGFFIEGMGLVAKRDIKGDGGEFGMKLINTLHGMTQKVLQETE